MESLETLQRLLEDLKGKIVGFRQDADGNVYALIENDVYRVSSQQGVLTAEMSERIWASLLPLPTLNLRSD